MCNAAVIVKINFSFIIADPHTQLKFRQQRYISKFKILPLNNLFITVFDTETFNLKPFQYFAAKTEFNNNTFIDAFYLLLSAMQYSVIFIYGQNKNSVDLHLLSEASNYFSSIQFEMDKNDSPNSIFVFNVTSKKTSSAIYSVGENILSNTVLENEILMDIQNSTSITVGFLLK